MKGALIAILCKTKLAKDKKLFTQVSHKGPFLGIKTLSYAAVM